jgi:hypothetical protein
VIEEKEDLVVIETEAMTVVTMAEIIVVAEEEIIEDKKSCELRAMSYELQEK